jgi:hypothetical protein
VQDLILHVGLPKTGTTALQNDFFPQCQGYLGGASYFNNPGDHFESFVSLYFPLGRHPDFAARAWIVSARTWWEDARTLSPTPLVLSDEGLCRWRLSSHAGGFPFIDAPIGISEVRQGRALLPQLAQALATALEGSAQVRVILTIRNQNDFLASLYAQLTTSLMQNPSQLDFETKTRDMIRNRDAFVDWNSLVRDLQSTLGPENLLVCVFEDGLPQMASEMAEFIDPSWRPSMVIGEHNVRRQGHGTWTWTPPSRIRKIGQISSLIWPSTRAPKLRDSLTPTVRRLGLSQVRRIVRRLSSHREKHFDKQSIKVDDALRVEIQQSCFESNEALGQLLNRDLKPLGY